MYTPWRKLKRGMKYMIIMPFCLPGNLILFFIKLEIKTEKLFGISETHGSGISFTSLPKMMTNY